jgi:hypothetical protein
MPTYDLRPLVANRRARFGALVTALNLELVPSAVHRYNSEWGPRYLGRLPTETIPTETRRLTAFRGRLGLLIEYGLAVTMDDLLCADYGDEYRMSAEIVNKFPDFYLRRTNGEPQLRIDFKVLHDESAEYSARMTEPTTSLRADDDVLLYAAWRWSRTRLHGTELVFPEVAEAMAVSAIAIAQERDRNLVRRGGHVDADGNPKLGSGEPDTNYGKINRIVGQSRRDAPDLDSGVRAFITFVARNVPGAVTID